VGTYRMNIEYWYYMFELFLAICLLVVLLNMTYSVLGI